MRWIISSLIGIFFYIHPIYSTKKGLNPSPPKYSKEFRKNISFRLRSLERGISHNYSKQTIKDGLDLLKNSFYTQLKKRSIDDLYSREESISAFELHVIFTPEFFEKFIRSVQNIGADESFQQAYAASINTKDFINKVAYPGLLQAFEAEEETGV